MEDFSISGDRAYKCRILLCTQTVCCRVFFSACSHILLVKRATDSRRKWSHTANISSQSADCKWHTDCSSDSFCSGQPTAPDATFLSVGSSYSSSTPRDGECILTGFVVCVVKRRSNNRWPDSWDSCSSCDSHVWPAGRTSLLHTSRCLFTCSLEPQHGGSRTMFGSLEV